VGCAAALALAAATAAAQQPSPSPPRFEGGARLVTVDAVVTDAKGRVVRDLGPGDFRVFEDGQPRPLARFDPPARAERLAPARAVPVGGVARDAASLVVLLDDQHLTVGEGREAVRLLEELLCRGLSRDDRATLVVASSARWWTAAGGNVCAELVPKLRGLRGLVVNEHDDELPGAG
jgi:hypothetical protein